MTANTQNRKSRKRKRDECDNGQLSINDFFQTQTQTNNYDHKNKKIKLSNNNIQDRSGDEMEDDDIKNQDDEKSNVILNKKGDDEENNNNNDLDNDKIKWINCKNKYKCNYNEDQQNV